VQHIRQLVRPDGQPLADREWCGSMIDTGDDDLHFAAM
jgi:hypothetical protein